MLSRAVFSAIFVATLFSTTGCFSARHWPLTSPCQTESVETVVRDVQRHASQLRAGLDDADRHHLVSRCDARVVSALVLNGVVSPVRNYTSGLGSVPAFVVLAARRETDPARPLSAVVLGHVEAAAAAGPDIPGQLSLSFAFNGLLGRFRHEKGGKALGSEPNDRYLMERLEAIALATGRPEAGIALAVRSQPESLATWLTWGGSTRGAWEAAECEGRSWDRCEAEAEVKYRATIVKTLLAHKVPPPPTVCLAEPAFVDLAREIVQAGADPRKQAPACFSRYGSVLYRVGQQGFPTVEMRAAAAEVKSFLLNRGVPRYNGMLVDTTCCSTRAMSKSQSLLAVQLLELGHDPNEVPAHYDGETALQTAVRMRFVWLAEQLLKHRANPNLPSIKGPTPFDEAAAQADPTMATLLGRFGGLPTAPAVLAERIQAFKTSRAEAERKWRRDREALRAREAARDREDASFRAQLAAEARAKAEAAARQDAAIAAEQAEAKADMAAARAANPGTFGSSGPQVLPPGNAITPGVKAAPTSGAALPSSRPAAGGTAPARPTNPSSARPSSTACQEARNARGAAMLQRVGCRTACERQFGAPAAEGCMRTRLGTRSRGGSATERMRQEGEEAAERAQCLADFGPSKASCEAACASASAGALPAGCDSGAGSSPGTATEN